MHPRFLKKPSWKNLRSDDGRGRDRWTPILSSTIPYSVCKPVLRDEAFQSLHYRPLDFTNYSSIPWRLPIGRPALTIFYVERLANDPPLQNNSNNDNIIMIPKSTSTRIAPDASKLHSRDLCHSFFWLSCLIVDICTVVVVVGKTSHLMGGALRLISLQLESEWVKHVLHLSTACPGKSYPMDTREYECKGCILNESALWLTNDPPPTVQ